MRKQSRWQTFLVGMVLVLTGCGSENANETEPMDVAVSSDAGDQRLLIIGQDLSAIRGYMSSDCCLRPDGLTAYLDIYDLLKPNDFGGLGIDLQGEPSELEFSWGGGPTSAYKTAHEFGVPDIAIGLSIRENNQPQQLNKDDHSGKLERLGEGDYDNEIRHLARFADLVDGQVYLRIGYEFDGAWNTGYENHEHYVNAFRRIVDVLRSAGADNIEYVWQASTAGIDEIIDGRHEDISLWYPGDDYVDWMGLSWFMNPNEEAINKPEGFDPMTPGELSDELINFARAKGKPVMIAEASPQSFDLKEGFVAHHHAMWDGESASDKQPMTDAEIWDYWFAPMFKLMDDNRDVIRALAYINVDWDSQELWGPPYNEGFWGDTRLEVNAELARRFNDAIAAWKASP